RVSQAAAPARQGCRSHRSLWSAVRPAHTVARLFSLLCQPSNRCGVDRAEEIPREGRGGWVQATPGRAGALSILAHESRRGTCARMETAMVAQATLDQAKHHKGRSGRNDGSDHAKDGGGAHWLPEGRPRSGGDQSGCKAAPAKGHPACNVVARIPRTV